MSVIEQNTLYTPEDLLRLDDAVRYELVDGTLVERNMGMDSSAIALWIGSLLMAFVRREGLGGHLFGADGSYQCFADAPAKVRKPNVSFIRAGRLAQEQRPKGHCPIPPDLAVEVVSPNDLFHDVDEKIDEYLSAGVSLVWVVSPETRSVHVYRRQADPEARSALHQGDDTITGEDVLPGFSCKVADFFI
jgi:Uma2 family endonuclease